jgi:hypothetical protein
MWMLEQPMSSLLQFHPRFRELIRRFEIYRTFIWMGAFGADSPKGTFLYSMHPCLEDLSGRPFDRAKFKGLLDEYYDVNGKACFDGNDLLKVSQAYPKDFGVAVGDLYSSNEGAIVAAARAQPCAALRIDELASNSPWDDAQIERLIAKLKSL